MPDLQDELPANGKWDGAEPWMPLAWQLCADECGEDACTELVWEGGPIPEPWGDRWLKYEDEAKRLIALVEEHALPIQLAQRDATIAELRARILELEADAEDGAGTMEYLAEKVLHPIANILKGEPRPMSRHSWDDFPEMVGTLNTRVAVAEELAAQYAARAELLQDQVDAMRADAERYRWLRSDDIEVLPGQNEIFVVRQALPFSDDPDETLFESELDAAIDAAMSGQAGGN